MTTVLLLAGVALPFVISPGASFTITVTSATDGDRLSPLKVWAGTALGITALALVAGLTGVGALVASSATAQLVFGVAGGCVLAVLGASVLRGSLATGGSSPQSNSRPARLVPWAFFALITNVKALTLYALVLPAIKADVAGLSLYLGFGAVHITLLLIWLSLIGFAVVSIPGMQSDRARCGLSLLGGTFMIALGVQAFLVAVR